MSSPSIPLQSLAQHTATTNNSKSTSSTTTPTAQSQSVPLSSQAPSLSNNPPSLSSPSATTPTIGLPTQQTATPSQQNTLNIPNAGLQPSRPNLTSSHTSGTTLHTTASPQPNTSNTSASSQATSLTVPSAGPSISSPTPASTQQASTAQAQLSQPPTNPAGAVTGNINAFNRSRCSIFIYWLRLIIAFIVYIFTLGIALSATSRHSLLGLVNGSWGTWFLAILAKAGAIAFAFAVADTFDCFAWGKLKKRKRKAGPEGFDGTRLGWFLAVVSSPGVVGLTRILFRNCTTLRKQRKTWAAPHWGFFRKSRERWKRWRTARWSFARLAFIIVLIPGPGIILLGK